MVFTDLYKRAREGLRSNEYLGVHSNGVEQLDDITRSHANASEADRLPNIPLLGGAVNVDVSGKGIAVAGFEALQPEDARDDRITAGGVHRQNLAGRHAAFENGSSGHVITDFFPHAEFADWRGIRATGIAETEFRGGDREGARGFSIAEQNHLLVGSADDHLVLRIGGAADEEKGGADQKSGTRIFKTAQHRGGCG